MATCGMYDGAGEWLYTVGLPAKSGVAGGLLVVVPGQLGLAVFSPPLDANGNTVRGVRVCRDLVRDLGLHPLRTDGPRPAAVRATYGVHEVGSKRRRTPGQRAILATVGQRCLVVEVQGVVTYLTPDELAGRVEAGAGRGAGPRGDHPRPAAGRAHRPRGRRPARSADRRLDALRAARHRRRSQPARRRPWPAWTRPWGGPAAGRCTRPTTWMPPSRPSRMRCSRATTRPPSTPSRWPSTTWSGT